MENCFTEGMLMTTAIFCSVAGTFIGGLMAWLGLKSGIKQAVDKARRERKL